MSQTINWRITITGDQDVVEKITQLSSATNNELCQKIAITLQESLGLTSLTDITVRRTEEQPSQPEPEDNYDASDSLVRLITSDFEGTLYPFALALGGLVEAYIKELQQAGKLDSHLHTLDTEMHQMMTEIARHYARTGRWQQSD